MTTFPKPTWFDKRRRWSLSSLLAYEAALAGRPPPDPLGPEDERYLTAPQVRARYRVSDMWLHRRRSEAAETVAA